MQPIHKKTRRRRGRQFFLPAALLMLCLIVGLGFYLTRPAADESPDTSEAASYGELNAHTEDDVLSVSAAHPDGTAWRLIRSENGFVPADGDWPVNQQLVSAILRVTATVSYEDTVAEDAAALRGRESEFGLDAPLHVTVTYRGGDTLTFHLGAAVEGESLRYMTVDGFPALYVVPQGTWDALCVTAQELHAVRQPDIQKARIDRISVYDADTLRCEWSLSGEVTDPSAGDHWQLTFPMVYPADPEALTNLRANIANIRMGTYICEAEPAQLAEHGLEVPFFRLTVHQAAAAVNGTDESGAISVINKPESETVFALGSKKNEFVYYCLYDDSVWAVSAFSMDVFTAADPRATLSRYPVPFGLGELSTLEIRTASATDLYALDTSADASSCLLNGSSFPYEAFEAAYVRLENASVSGTLPDGWNAADAPHTVYTFTAAGGQVHRIALAAYDALHDAVIVDGSALFYIIKDGFRFDASAR